MTKFQMHFPKIVLLLGLMVIAGATSGCASDSLKTGVGEQKAPHQDGGTANTKKTMTYAPFNFIR